MPPSRPDHSWLPEHQLHVAYTLAHVDTVIARTGELLHNYFESEPFLLEQVVESFDVKVQVQAVTPLPAAVARYAADAMTQLRAAIEHTIFAEVEYLLGRALTDEEARAIEMPAAVSETVFTKWLNHGRRRGLPPLREGGPLVRRLRLLQPFQRTDVDNHPMRVLAEHTNLAKHRTPAVAAVRLGAVKLDAPAPGASRLVWRLRSPVPRDRRSARRWRLRSR
jgi:hypothetical protein